MPVSMPDAERAKATHEQSRSAITRRFLFAYLLIVGFAAVVLLWRNFPTEKVDERGGRFVEFPHLDKDGNVDFVPFGVIGTGDQGLLIIAMLAGVAGSFIHAAQSLASYVGNREFERSWTGWYVTRPWIGGVLGMSIYFVFRAGFVGGATTVNPYGVAALGVLGGWFSKTAADKLQEVFETLFKTAADEQRKDKLSPDRPFIESVTATQNRIEVRGRNFKPNAVVLFGDARVALKTDRKSDGELSASLDGIADEQKPGAECVVCVRNPEAEDHYSEVCRFKVS